jgi:hypothetical protein
MGKEKRGKRQKRFADRWIELKKSRKFLKNLEG